MKQERIGPGLVRAVNLVNYCNSQVLNINEQAIIRVLFMHVSHRSVDNSILSLEQLAREANISVASVSRFIRKIGYASFDDFRTNFVHETEQIYHNRTLMHANAFGTRPSDAVFDYVYQRSLANLQATYASLDREALWEAVRLMDNARSVTIYGDEHVLSDLYTLQLDLIGRGVGTFLYKNEQMQTLHAQHIQEGDVVLFCAVARDFVRPDQLRLLQELHEREGVTTLVFCQDDDDELRSLCDHYLTFGCAGSLNEGFHSLWYLSLLMSEMLYEL